MTTVGTIEERAERDTTRFFAIVAGVVALVLSAVVVFVVRHDGVTSPTVEPRTGVNTPLPASPKTLIAADVSWSKFFATSLPAASAGPHEISENRAREFDRTAAGAVLAAIHIGARIGTTAGPAVFEPTIREQVVGADKDRLLGQVQASYDEARSRYGVGPSGEIEYPAVERAATANSWVAAYRVDLFTPEAATVQLLLRTVAPGTTNPFFVNLATNVRWVEGDWRLVAPVDGNQATGSSRVQEPPAGYVLLGQPEE